MEVPTSVDRTAGDIHVDGNPHIHTDPLNGIIIARNILKGLQRVAPAESAQWAAREQDFERRVLEATMGRELVQILTPATAYSLLESGKLDDFIGRQQYQGKPLADRLGGWLAQGGAAARLRKFFDLIIVNMTSGSPPRGCLTTRTALDAAISSAAVRKRVQDLLGRLEQLISKAIRSAPDGRPAIDANRLARVVVTFTRGLAVMERAGYSRKQLNEAAATFVEALVGKDRREQ